MRLYDGIATTRASQLGDQTRVKGQGAISKRYSLMGNENPKLHTFLYLVPNLIKSCVKAWLCDTAPLFLEVGIRAERLRNSGLEGEEHSREIGEIEGTGLLMCLATGAKGVQLGVCK